MNPPTVTFYRDFDNRPITRAELRDKALALSERGDHTAAFRLLWDVNGEHPHLLLEEAIS